MTLLCNIKEKIIIMVNEVSISNALNSTILVFAASNKKMTVQYREKIWMRNNVMEQPEKGMMQ